MADWISLLDARDGRALPHKDIARLLHDEFGVPGWWSQMVTVEYERAIGRREVGQRESGEFRTTMSRTVHATIEGTLERWIERLPATGEAAGFDGVVFASEPTPGGTEKRRTWRVDLADGARVTAYVSARVSRAGADTAASAAPASVLAVEVSRLDSTDDIARWKAFWKGYLAEF